MNISRTAWDRWAPVAYVFLIGLAVGFVTGFALGIVNGRSGAIYVLLLPVIAIVAAFVIFYALARKVSESA